MEGHRLRLREVRRGRAQRLVAAAWLNERGTDGERGGGGRELLVSYCAHSKRQTAEEEYGGEQYIEALKRLRGTAALRVAGLVESFFWQDAVRVRVRF
jgi:hypothetical protein